MSEVASSNWTKLVELGGVPIISRTGSSASIERLPLTIALRLAVNLTLNLDKLGSAPSLEHKYLTYDRAFEEAQERIAARNRFVFGEYRPARANMAVRVEDHGQEQYDLRADIRNAYEDHPELNGGEHLKRILHETVEALEL